MLPMPDPTPKPAEPQQAASRPLTPAAKRALAEAAARRSAAETGVPPAQRETSGRGGLEPVRYGDWEIKGLASDF